VTSDELIAEVGKRIAQAAPGATMVVFGSHARGEANTYSDLDLLIIEPDVENTAAESVRLRDALGGLPSAIDVIVVSQSHVDEWRDVRGSLVHAALSEGRVIAA
jgi:predicted nucleotidyltransferase